MHNSGL